MAAVVIAIVAFRSENRRARFENARALHHDLTTGEVGAARTIIGNLHYGGLTPSDSRRVGPDELTAYFTVLWCFERIEAGRTALLRGALRTDGTNDEAVGYLDALIAWHVAEFACGFAVARSRLATTANADVSDGSSSAAFWRLLQAMQERGMVDPLYRAGSCPGPGCPCSCHSPSLP
ncbi:hypothetical protein [Embleya sp. NPDC005575]|uniref:hypothetical protein n=1 Tax=Embleya sp. NPDC005575 TaxID=3156892 RepID=UPI0033B3FB23